jgi:putative ABC transport system permease protein
LLRTLIYRWPIHLAVILGAAVATAVLTGALLVGDSVRGSLADLTRVRLGGVDHALVAERFFRQELADALPGSSPAIVLRGAAESPGSGARASRVSVMGVDERFDALHGSEVGLARDASSKPMFPAVVINESLRRELGAEVGDAILLRFGSWSDVPRDTLMGDKDADAVLQSLRVTLTRVLPDRGLGGFGLTASQQTPLNAFVALSTLQRGLGVPGEVNALFAGATVDDPNATLEDALELGDLGLRLERHRDLITLGSREFVLRPEADLAIGETADELGISYQRTQSYLANRIRTEDRTLPYALVAALDPRPDLSWAALERIDGTPAEPPGENGILLNSWAASDLDVAAGDFVELSYFVVGPREELREDRARLEVQGVVAMRGLGADRTLTPEYPGIQETRDIADWDPPFPVDLDSIRKKDEEYWDAYGATPKAFVSEETGRRLWSTRFGSTTAVRIGVPDGEDAAELEHRLRTGLEERLSKASFGLVFRPVKRDGLEAARGATDFAGLFVAFSFFLIASAAVLVGLLFRLGVEQRAKEIGLLLSLGYRVPRVRRRLQFEGMLLAGFGGLLGLAGGVLYAGLLMAGLRTLWRPAVGSSELFLHVSTSSLVYGWVGSLAVVWISIALAVRRLVRLPLPMLLVGSVREPSRRANRRTAWVLASVGLAGALASSSIALTTGALDSPGLAFGAGASLLIAGLAGFALWIRRKPKRPLSARAWAIGAMASRNSSWNPGRSILSVSLMASACFVIVMVAANRGELEEDLVSRASGAGGFSLVAEADVPLHQDLNRSDGRFDLGFSVADDAALARAEVFPFRSLPGDDASCLNLFRPERPRLLGATEAFVDRGGFAFKQHLDLEAGQTDPWSLLDLPHEDGVIPAIGDYNSVFWILHLGLGDELTIEDAFGEPLRLRIVGLLQESVFQSELVIAEDDLLAHFPNAAGDGYFLVDTDGADAQIVAQALERALGDFGFDVSTTAQRIARFKVVQNTYLATFQVLGGLGLLLGSVGLGIVLIRNVIERRGELATMRAFGFRRSALSRLVLAENAFLLSVGIGIGSVAALIAAAPRLAGLHLPWASLLATLVVIALVGMLSSVAAVAGTLRTPMLPALKSDR